MPFAGAGVPPLVENPNIVDGDQIAVAFVSPTGRTGRVRMSNAFPAAFETLMDSIVALVPRFRGTRLERLQHRRQEVPPAAPDHTTAPR
jgi:hypothetical protein